MALAVVERRVLFALCMWGMTILWFAGIFMLWLHRQLTLVRNRDAVIVAVANTAGTALACVICMREFVTAQRFPCAVYQWSFYVLAPLVWWAYAVRAMRTAVRYAHHQALISDPSYMPSRLSQLVLRSWFTWMAIALFTAAQGTALFFAETLSPRDATSCTITAREFDVLAASLPFYAIFMVATAWMLRKCEDEIGIRRELVAVAVVVMPPLAAVVALNAFLPLATFDAVDSRMPVALLVVLAFALLLLLSVYWPVMKSARVASKRGHEMLLGDDEIAPVASIAASSEMVEMALSPSHDRTEFLQAIMEMRRPSFAAIVSDKIAWRSFCEFAAACFQEKPVAFYTAIRALHGSVAADTERARVADAIIRRFVRSSAPQLYVMPEDVTRALVAAADLKDLRKLASRTLFDQAEQYIYYNLQTVYYEDYMHSSRYKVLVMRLRGS